MKKRWTKGKKGPVQSKKIEVDGIVFASGLEKYCYLTLKEAGLYDKYEGEKFVLIEGFHFENKAFERQSNGKKGFVDRGSKKVLAITYTPDFTSHDYIIETKGRANESFPIRYKLFKNLLNINKDKRTLYKPQNQAEVDETVKLIILERNGK